MLVPGWDHDVEKWCNEHMNNQMCSLFGSGRKGVVCCNFTAVLLALLQMHYSST